MFNTVVKEISMENVSLNALFKEKRLILNHFASQFTSDYDEKEDLVQETLIRALKSIHNFINDPKLMTWLYVIMKNIYINQYRRERRKSVVYDDYLNLTIQSSMVINISENNLLEDDIKKALDSLPSEHAETFRMYLDGFKYHEIAEHFNVPEGTIKSRIYLTRKKLQQKLEVYHTLK